MKASFWRFRPRREFREAIQLLSRKCEIAPGMCFLNTVFMPLVSDLDNKQGFFKVGVEFSYKTYSKNSCGRHFYNLGFIFIHVTVQCEFCEKSFSSNKG